jgi:hypothetical protein
MLLYFSRKGIDLHRPLFGLLFLFIEFTKKEHKGTRSL